MRILLAATIGLLSTTPATAADRAVAPKVALESLGLAFEAAAGEFDLATEISGGVCDEARPATCRFIGEGGLEIQGTADTVDSPPTTITLLYRDNGPAWPLPLNVGLLVSIVEPEMSRDDRYLLTMRILDLAGQNPANNVIYGHSAKFKIGESAGQIEITAEPVL